MLLLKKCLTNSKRYVIIKAQKRKELINMTTIWKVEAAWIDTIKFEDEEGEN